MNFYAVIGRTAAATLRAVVLDRSAQDELTATFSSQMEMVRQADRVAFDPSYRADQGEVVSITDYELPSMLGPLASPTSAEDLESLDGNDIEHGNIQGIIGVQWEGRSVGAMAFQKTDSRYVLRRERWRFMLADGRFVRDERPGLEISERIDALFEDETLYVASWPRAHALLTLTAYTREATLAEAREFLRHAKLRTEAGFDAAAVADSTVRRRIASIQARNVLGRCAVNRLRAYASKFELELRIVGGRIVLPADKKRFKAVLDLLDENMLEFEPTDERWIVNSKRRAVQP
jgi:hypothetical protein